MEKFCDVILVT